MAVVLAELHRLDTATSTSRERITVLPATMPSAVATVRVKLGPCEYQCWNSIQAR
jgi:hypothetical protein